MNYRFLAVVFICLIVITPVYADEIRPTSRITQTTQQALEIENPKAVTEFVVNVIQSGSISVTGSMKKANLSVYVPQDATSITVSTEGTWSLVQDKFGNRLVLFEWTNPKGIIDYIIESVVNNRAKILSTEKALGSDITYLGETETILFSKEISEAAFPFDKTMKRVAEMSVFVSDIMDYDISLVGFRKSSIWALENKRGVCVEHANLLTAMLRSAGIPTRYVVGYAYSTRDKKLIGHTWVEVLAKDGTWIPFDPTWLQGGYLDATHIKTGNLLDDDQKDTLMYVGSGTIDWTRNEDAFDVLDFKEEPLNDITAWAGRFAVNANGFLRAHINSGDCNIVDITAQSCIDSKDGKPLFIIKNAEQKKWFCGETDVYWVFEIKEGLSSSAKYTCPITMYDQSGNKQSVDIEITGTKNVQDIFISGPDTSSVNEVFTLEAKAGSDFLFFSPQTIRYSEKIINISFPKAGSYTFYLYEDGALTEKTINVMEKKEFNINADIPEKATKNVSFAINVSVKNIENKVKDATIQINFDGQIYKKNELFSPLQTKTIEFLIEPDTAGLKKIIISASSDSITSYSGFIDVIYNEPVNESSFIENVVSFFRGIIDAILGLF
jgi:hypothetical protein